MYHPAEARSSTDMRIDPQLSTSIDMKGNQSRLKRFLDVEDQAEDRPAKRARVGRNGSAVSCICYVLRFIPKCQITGPYNKPCLFGPCG